MQSKQRFILLVVAITAVLFGCNYPSPTGTLAPELSPTIYVQTLAALQTRAVMTATAQGFSAGPGTVPAGTPLPVTGGTPGLNGTVVINDTLCWRGPGPRYEVISAIFKGTQVQLIGKAVIPNWYIIRNPIYLDPCWVWAADIQLDPTVNLAALPIFNVPATPSVTPQPSPLVTETSPAPSATGSPIAPTPTANPTDTSVPAPTNTPAPTATATLAPTQPPSPTPTQ